MRWYRDYLKLFSRLYEDMHEEAKRRVSDMAKDYRDVFWFDEEFAIGSDSPRE